MTGCAVEPCASAPSASILSPGIPLLFMGEEYDESHPFQFFTDHIDPVIADATRAGRRREFARFAAFAGHDVPDPQDPATFARSKSWTVRTATRCTAATTGCCSSSGGVSATAPSVGLQSTRSVGYSLSDVTPWSWS